MGIMQHDVVIATTWNNVLVNRLKTQDFFCESRFLIGKAKINNVTTVCLISDGSNVGWPESDVGDALRGQFIEFIDICAYSDNSNAWTYVEVTFGELGKEITRDNVDPEIIDEEDDE